MPPASRHRETSVVKSVVSIAPAACSAASGRKMCVAMVAGLWPMTGNAAYLTLFCGYAMFSFTREWFGLPGTYKFQ